MWPKQMAIRNRKNFFCHSQLMIYILLLSRRWEKKERKMDNMWTTPLSVFFVCVCDDSFCRSLLLLWLFFFQFFFGHIRPIIHSVFFCGSILLWKSSRFVNNGQAIVLFRWLCGLYDDDDDNDDHWRRIVILVKQFHYFIIYDYCDL